MILNKRTFSKTIFCCASASAFLVALLAVTSTPVTAEESPAHSERVRHYQPKAPESAAGAVTSFQAALKEIELLLSSSELDMAKLEKVHQISYSLEAAAEKLIEQDETSSDYKALMDAVLELHQASEDHKAESTKESFKKTAALFEKIKS